MTSASRLEGSRVVVIGAGSGIGRAIAHAVAKAGATVLVSGRDQRKLEWTAGELGGAEAVAVDLADEDSIAALASKAGQVDHVISTAAAAANGPLADLTKQAIDTAFAAKVTGPLLLAKHFDVTGSMLFFSGVIAWRPAPQRTVMATTNGALAHLVQALAVELAPVRVNAVSPGIVDSGAWDGMGEGKAAFLDSVAAKNPARRVGSTEDLTEAALFALTNRFTTGTVLHVDGGGRLA
ncbi:NAD(P)-dependent dehydrogenase, short-chain alcohol dehydrogenase family [Amycolatopsis xylanica]|uniref:NAD(P)-dependent dehydrogenase, short-chain alcohol dehydrogenase family n=1 Tax=Amycolatopsis xylanica TaxID=589385 RepID=A0A1H3G132_9PSEU|nr:SDR family oxidoreductase [Amycolatopsis xylanica]SDX96805.1 NAD(P)-dependent dehydrogenase, short-chain alcohol dehydrogenase family [Amycolatopsis xylanica]